MIFGTNCAFALAKRIRHSAVWNTLLQSRETSCSSLARGNPSTRATIIQAYRKAKERIAKGLPISGPKKLDVFGASYLYPIFNDLGLFE